MKPIRTLIALTIAFTLPAAFGFAHCQIPCGIYGDQMRFDMINEHITTIEKAMNEINRLGAEGDKNYNQLVRWIINKDEHAEELTHIVTYYFMAQRVKPAGTDDAEYVKKITTLHSIMVEAMKAKQTTDLEHVKNLRELTKQFHDLYFTEADKAHMKEQHQGADMEQPSKSD